MCLCCGSPDGDHGESGSITRDDLKRAAEAAVIVHAIGES